MLICAAKPPKIFSDSFGSEGATTTSTAYASIANSDKTLDPSLFLNGGNLWARFMYHTNNTGATGTTSICVIRQNAGSTVNGSQKTSIGTGWVWNDTGWINFSNENTRLKGSTWGYESYQIQLKTSSGQTAKYNSAIILLSYVNF